MAALFDRIKTWVAETLYAADLNAEIQNIIDKFSPEWMNDYSDSVSQMQSTADPGSLGSENQATSLSEELQQIRYAIARIISADFSKNWYEAPERDLSASSGGVNELKLYFGFQPDEGTANGTDGAYADALRSGAIGWALRRSLNADLQTDDFEASIVKFGGYSYKTGARGDSSVRALVVPAKHVPQQGTLSLHGYGLFPNDYYAFNRLLGLELKLTALGYLEFRQTLAAASDESTKSSLAVTGSDSRSGITDWHLFTAKWRTNGAAGAGTDLIEAEYDTVEEGTQLTSQTIATNPGAGGNWVFGANKNDPTWDHFYAANDTPENHSSAWTKTGTGSATVSGGVLTLAPSNNNVYYSRTTLVDLSQHTIEFKARLPVHDYTAVPPGGTWKLLVRDDSMDRSYTVFFDTNRILFNAPYVKQIFINTQDWHVYRITSDGGTDPVTKFYIDDVLVYEFTNDVADVTAGDRIQWGVNDSEPTATAEANFEYFAVYDAGAEPPITETLASGYLDDIAVASTIATDGLLASLLTQSASSVYNGTGNKRLSLPIPVGATTQAGLSNNAAVDADFFIHSDGRARLSFHFQIAQLLSAGTAGGMYAFVATDPTAGTSADVGKLFGGGTGTQTGANVVSLHTSSAVLPLGVHKGFVRIQFAGGGTSTVIGTSSIAEVRLDETNLV